MQKVDDIVLVKLKTGERYLGVVKEINYHYLVIKLGGKSKRIKIENVFSYDIASDLDIFTHNTIFYEEIDFASRWLVGKIVFIPENNLLRRPKVNKKVAETPYIYLYNKDGVHYLTNKVEKGKFVFRKVKDNKVVIYADPRCNLYDLITK